MTPHRAYLGTALILLLSLAPFSAWSAEVAVVAPESPLLRFALGKVEAALRQRGDTLRSLPHDATRPAGALRVSWEVAEAGNLGEEGFRLSSASEGPTVIGGGERGAMYGLLEVADLLQAGTPLGAMPEKTVRPQLAFRAIKFNLPWSAYRTSEALEQHQETCKDLRFWEAFLDMMAENRFNVLSLWNLHPFTYLVRPKNFPEACPWNEAELAEWRALWNRLFAMAKQRGIETYLVNWNIFVSPAFARAHQVAPWSVNLSHIGKETDATNELVERYTREVVTQVLDEYPELTGLGITLGERMGGMTPDQRRAWIERTIVAGIARAQRPVKFIYRAPLSANTASGGTTSEENDRRSRSQIESLPANIAGPVWVEFKHNWSHAHSSPDLYLVHGGPLSDAYWNPPPTRHQVVWTMRNEDFFILRWGQPDFVREFVQRQSGAPHVGGAIIGSECYIPARDYFTRAGPHQTWRWAFERQWLFYAVWGRLLFDPSTPDTRFSAMLEQRFGAGLGQELLAAWKFASQVPLRFASFYRGTWDGSLYTEGFSTWRDNAARTLIDIENLISHPVLDTKRYVNIADFVRAGRAPSGKMSPLDLATLLDRDCASAHAGIAKLSAHRSVTPALDCEMTDIEAWCAFGNYFASKLRAGVALATARQRQDPALQNQAIAELELALAHWQRLARLGERFNRLPVPSNAKDPFSWSALTPAVAKDIDRARTPLIKSAHSP